MSLLKRLGGTPQGSDSGSATNTATATPVMQPVAPPPVEQRSAAPDRPVPSANDNGSSSLAERVGVRTTEDVPTNGNQQRMLELSLWIVDRIQASLGTQTELKQTAETERLIQERFANYYRQSNTNLPDSGVKHLYEMVVDELFGFGPIQKLLNDPAITEVMVNGPDRVYIEQKGKVTITDVHFAGEDHIMKVIDRIIRPLGRRIDRKWPMVDARLPDGSRVNAIIPPCSIDGSTVTIRKFSKNKLQIQDLVQFGSITSEMGEFLRACVVSRLNIVVSGGTGSGKTTLLNVLSNFIPSTDRIVTIEDSAELQLAQVHVVRLESKPVEVDGTGLVAIRDLVKNSLRMRPDRIIVGECRSGETLDMLQAMNTGHDGSLTTLHANDPRSALARMETMSLMAGLDMPIRVIREQIASAIDLIVQQTRLDDGSRMVSNITEVQGMEGDTVVMQDIFALDQKGKSPDGKIIAELKPTGVRPRFTPRLEANNFRLPPSMFGTNIPGQKNRW